MPIVSASNGIRPEIRALAVIKLNKPVTPKEINDCVGTGDYAAKYVSFLNTRYGFTIETQKDGRRVVSYTCIAEPKNVAELRAMKPKTKAAKPAKATKQVADPVAAKQNKLKPATEEQIRAKNLETMKKVTAKKTGKKIVAKAAAKKIKVDPVEQTLGSTGEVATSFTVDAGWDSMENVNVKDFLR
jgi:hypothetical protein